MICVYCHQPAGEFDEHPACVEASIAGEEIADLCLGLEALLGTDRYVWEQRARWQGLDPTVAPILRLNP